MALLQTGAAHHPYRRCLQTQPNPSPTFLGVLGNLACHAAAQRQLLGQTALPDLLLDRLLWVDDAAALAELCRCLSSLLTDTDRQVRQVRV